MIFCINCKSIDVKILDLDFADTKPEGQPATKFISSKRQFQCLTCKFPWFPDSDTAEKLYAEYQQLKNETTLVTHVVSSYESYKPQHLDSDKLMRRYKLAKELMKVYKHDLDLNPVEWHELAQDAGPESDNQV